MAECKVIAIANHKGGVGKSSLAVNLGVGLVQQGKKVLVIDCDPQGNTSYWLGVADRQRLDKTIFSLMKMRFPSDYRTDDLSESEEEEERVYLDEFEKTVIHQQEGVDLIPANLRFSLMERELILSQYSATEVFKRVVDPLRDRYDFILVDCPPSVATVVVNILSGVDSVLIPVKAEPLSEEGLSDLIGTIRSTRKNQNHHLEIDGIVIAISKTRANVASSTRAEIEREYDGKIAVFDTVIYENVKLAESPKSGTSIFTYSPKSKAAKEYSDLAKEVIEYHAEED